MAAKKTSKQSNRKTIDTVFVLLGAGVAIFLIIVGAISWYAYRFADNSVTTELSAQKVFFPTTDSPAYKALPAADQQALQPYAGQQLTNGAQAKVYANNFIAVHLDGIAGGKTYAEVSTEAMKDPKNTTLQTQKALLFQGETLRGILLGDGYAYWTFGQIARFASFAAFAGAAVFGLLTVLGYRHLRQL